MKQKKISGSDWQMLREAFQRMNIPISQAHDDGQAYQQECFFFLNRDGSLRWLWPDTLKAPEFLRFYHTGSLVSKLFVFCIQVLYRLGFPRLAAHGRCKLYLHKEELFYFKSAWALFTGTAGPNRKILWWRASAQGAGSIYKIAASGRAYELIAHEAASLKKIEQEKPVYGLVSPKCLHAYPGVMQQELFDLSTCHPVSSLQDIPAVTLMEWLGNDMRQEERSNLSFTAAIQERLSELKQNRDIRIPPALLRKTDMLWQQMQAGSIKVARAHGDFTPWNMRLNGESLLLFDWEMYREQMPALFDLFHFSYQTAVLVKHQSYKQMRKELDGFMSQEVWQQFAITQQLDLGSLEQWYLLYTITYYLQVYSQQAQWHMQVNWLLNMWDQAVSDQLLQNDAGVQRVLLMEDLFKKLSGKAYAAMKMGSTDPLHIPASSDIDLCMKEALAESTLYWLSRHRLVKKARVEKYSYMIKLLLQLQNGSFLHLDFIHAFKQKHRVYMQADEVLAGRVTNRHGVQVASEESDFKYISLFYLLNQGEIPEKYRFYYISRNFQLEERLNKVLEQLSGCSNCDYIRFLSDTRAWQQVMNDYTSKLSFNRGLPGLLNRLQYVFDLLKGFHFRKGFVVTFSGVDGAGKSTIISEAAKILDKQLRQRVVILRHRPSILPVLSAWKYGKQQAEQQAAASLPRQGSNRNFFSSLFRFSYYLLDYLLGQFYVQVKYVWRGYVVLYDRYYFDFINDSRRSNIQLPRAFVAFFYKLLLKPRYNFFLYAPAEEILKRKKELDAATIARLTERYQRLFDTYKARYRHSTYVSLYNHNLRETLQECIQHIQKVA